MIQACKQAHRQVIGTSTSNLILVDYHIPQEKKSSVWGPEREGKAGRSKQEYEGEQAEEAGESLLE